MMTPKHPDLQDLVNTRRCQVVMSSGRCGRLIYPAPEHDEEPVCLMHSRDPQKSDSEFQQEFEGTLTEATDRNEAADFTRFIFPSAKYAHREFKTRCRFDYATFTQQADFSDATFTQNASFSCATFTQNAIFDRAAFMQTAYFYGVKFAQEASFCRATFMQDAVFSHATLTQNACFLHAEFTQEAHFEEATFAELVHFIQARFAASAAFRETVFRGDKKLEPETDDALPGPVFSLAQFEKPELVLFYKTYLGQALFHNCDVSKFVFSNVRWRQRPNGRRMVLEQGEKLDLTAAVAQALRPEEGSADERNYGLVAELYQQLKKNYDDRKDYWTAGDFHYGEMEMKRLACPRLTWLGRLEAKLSAKPRSRRLGAWCGALQSDPWLLSKVRRWHQRFGLAAWYRRASDYGESWGKPLLWLFAVLVIFAALYPFLGLTPARGKSLAAKATSLQVETPSPQETGLRYWNYERPGRLFWHSVMTSLGVAAFQRDLAYEPSYPWGRLLALLELLLTSTLIALFLLALRRQFKR
jgi:hypothetical protein